MYESLHWLELKASLQFERTPAGQRAFAIVAQDIKTHPEKAKNFNFIETPFY